MSIDWAAAVKAYYDELPHPKAPGLKIKEFATAVKIATQLKFGSHATAAEAELFWPHFQATGMSPDEFQHAVQRIAPLSYAYHGRPPTLHEIVQLKDRPPKEASTYFSDLPDKDYPHVSAGAMVKAMQSANPHAQEYLDRPAMKNEAAYLHHSGQSPADFYQHLSERDQAVKQSANMDQQNVVHAPFGSQPTVSSPQRASSAPAVR